MIPRTKASVTGHSSTAVPIHEYSRTITKKPGTIPLCLPPPRSIKKPKVVRPGNVRTRGCMVIRQPPCMAWGYYFSMIWLRGVSPPSSFYQEPPTPSLLPPSRRPRCFRSIGFHFGSFFFSSWVALILSLFPPYSTSGALAFLRRYAGRVFHQRPTPALQLRVP